MKSLNMMSGRDDTWLPCVHRSWLEHTTEDSTLTLSFPGMPFLRPISSIHWSGKTEGRHVWAYPQGKEKGDAWVYSGPGLGPVALELPAGWLSSLGLTGGSTYGFGIKAPVAMCLALSSVQVGDCGRTGFELKIQGPIPTRPLT